MMKLVCGWIAVVVVVVTTSGQKPRLVKDINAQLTPTHSSPRPGHDVQTFEVESLVTVLDTTYFVADDPLRGTELFFSKGTAASTGIAMDIRYGGGDSWPEDLTSDGVRLFFSATNGLAGRELWMAEPLFGTVTMLRDINPRLGEGSDPKNLFAFGGRVFFSASDLGGANHEPWISDGTSAGTRKIKELVPGNTASSDPSGFFGHGNWVYFQASDGTARGLWRTDGTAAGTSRMGRVSMDAGHPHMQAFGGWLYFSARTSSTGLELFRLDPATATIQVAHDVYPGPTGSNPRDLTVSGGHLYFVADGIAPGAVYRSGEEIWSTDGTSLRLYDLHTGHRGSNPREMLAYSVGGQPVLLVVAVGLYPGTRNPTGYELWQIDARGFEVRDLVPGNTGSMPRGLTVGAGGRCFFSAVLPQIGREMLETDGTKAGTRLFRRLNLYGNPNGSHPAFFTRQANGDLLFVCDNGPDGRELWKSDGTVAGTKLLADLNPRATTTQGSRPKLLAGVGEGICFTARSGQSVSRPLRTMGLWVSDGTEPGTGRVAALDAFGLADAGDAAVAGSKLFVVGNGNDAKGAAIGYEMWCVDRRTNQVAVLDLRSGAAGSVPLHLTAFGGLLYFSAIGDPGPAGERGRELWVSDGTQVGTRIVADLYAGKGSSNPDHFYVYRDRLFFAARDQAHGEELWMVPSPGAAPVRLSDLYVGDRDGQPHGMVGLGDRLLFIGTSATHGRELQALDLASLTLRTIDIRSGVQGSMRRSTAAPPFAVVGGYAYFAAEGDLHQTGGAVGMELWRSDGTLAGTTLVTDVWPGTSGSDPGGLTQIGDSNLLMFFASTGVGTSRDYDGLWVSDGTNTFTLQRLPAGWRGTGVSRSGRLGARYAFAQVPFYSAASDELGTDLYISDGTLAGTVRVCRDTYATSLNEAPTDAILAEDGRLFTVRVHPDYGAELWVLDELAIAAPRGSSCAWTSITPRLRSADPILGRSLSVALDSPGLGVTPGVLMIGMWEPVPIAVGSCAMHVRPFGPVVFRGIATDATGRWRGALRTDRGVAGLRYALQAALLGPNGQPPALTNAVVLSPGTK